MKTAAKKRKTGRKKSARPAARRRAGARPRSIDDETMRDVVDEELEREAGLEPPLAPGKIPLPSGGERVTEDGLLAEEDDFEDGRSSSGLQSRRDTDPAAHGDVSSRAFDVPTGVLSVESGSDSSRPRRPRTRLSDKPRSRR